MQIRWQMLAVATIARTAMGFQYQSVAPVAPLLGQELGLDQAGIGWLIGLYMLPGVVLALPGGMLGTRFGDKRVAVAALCAMVAGALLMATADGARLLDAGRLLSGTGAVVFNVLAAKMIADWFSGRELVLAMSVLINSWPIGIGLALLSLGAVAEAESWRAAFVISAAVAAVGAAAMALRYRVPPDAARVGRTRLRSIDARTWKLLAIASLPWLFFNAAGACLMSFVPTYLVSRGESVAIAASMTSMLSLLAVATVQLGGVFVHRYGRADQLAIISMLSVVVAGIGLLTAPWPLAWICLIGLVWGLPASVLVSLPGQLLSAESRGTGMGIFYTFYYFGMALLPAAAGLASDIAGDTAAALWVGVLAAAATPAALVWLRRVQRASAAQQAAQ